MNGLRITALLALLGLVLVAPETRHPLAVGCIWAACLAVLARSHPNGMLSLGALYLLLLGLFHLGLVVPIALGVTRAERPGWLSSWQLDGALGLVAAAIVAFTLGARLRAPPLEGEQGRTLPAQPQLFWVGTAVAVLGATLLWIGVWQLGLLSQGYSVYYERALREDVRFFGFGLMLFPIGLLVAAAGATPRRMFVLGAMLLLVLGPLFMRGFRGPTIVHVTALLAVWTRKNVRAARRVALAVAAGAMILVPAVRLSRDVEGAAGELGSVDPIAMVLEMGGSLYPLVVTAEVLESGREPPWMGRSYAMAAERLTLNLGARRRELSATRDLAPNSWVTLHADPWAFEHGYGIGFSGVAEPYLNFGLAGVVGFFLLLGFVIQSWDRSLTNHPFRAAVAAATFGFLLWTARNDSMELLRALGIATAVVAAAWSLAGSRARRLSRAARRQAARVAEPERAGAPEAS